MRTINKYLSVLAVAALAGFVSCQVEEVFKPGEEENEKCEGIYFPKQKKIEEVQIFDPTQAKVDTIKVRRSNEEGDSLTVTPAVSLSYTDAKGNTVKADSNVFKVSDIVFEPGQVETTIALDFEGVEEGVSYSLHIAIEGEEYASKYSSALKACDYKVMCVKYVDFVSPKDSTKAAKITFTQSWWGEVHTAYVKYYEVGGVRHCVTYGEAIDSAAFLASGSAPGSWGEKGFFGKGEDQHLEFLWYVEDIEECESCGDPHPCKVPAGWNVPEGSYLLTTDGPAWIFDHSSIGPVYMLDNYWVSCIFNGYSKSFLHYTEANDLFDETSYYDNNGGFYFYTYYNVNAAGSGWNVSDFAVVGIAEGFVRADYSLKLDAGMTQADSKGDNVVPVDFEVGADVAKVGYTILKGSASAAAIAAEVSAIAKDTIDYKYATYIDAAGKDFSDSISTAATGVYTLVAVSFDDKKQAKASASVTFEYLLTGETNEVVLSVAAAGTEKYASRGYSPITSIEYSISGSGLTGVIPMIYTEKEVDDEGGIDDLVEYFLSVPNVFNTALKDEDFADYYGLYPLTAKQLANANDKGFVDIATGLKALTTYYVIVWATNGYDVAVKYATHTTDGLPNEVIKNGTGYFDYAVFFDETDEVEWEGFNLEFNPNTGLYEIPDWGWGTALTFGIAKDSTISVPIQGVGYGAYLVADNSHIDEVCGEGAGAFFTENYDLDFTPVSYMDEDGNLHFNVFYGNTTGSLYAVGEEIFYPNGKPAAVTLKKVKAINERPEATPKKNAHRIMSAGEEGLKATYNRVEAKHNIGSASTSESNKAQEPARMQNKKNYR